MDAIFANAPTEPTVVAIRVHKIYCEVHCSIRRCEAQATTNIRPIDHVGRPQAKMDVCGPTKSDSDATYIDASQALEFG